MEQQEDNLILHKIMKLNGKYLKTSVSKENVNSEF